MSLRLGVNALFYLPGDVGGSETYLLETLHALTMLADRPRLVLFSNIENTPKLRQEFPNDEVVMAGIRATRRMVRIPYEQFLLPRMVRQAQVDVLWSPGYTAPVRCRCRQAVSILDMQYKRFPQDVSWVARRTMDLLYPLAARRSDAVVAISEFGKTEISRFLDVSLEKITVTPLAADPAFGEPSAPRPEFAHEKPYLLCVANTYPHKNVAMLVRAFNRIAAWIPHRLILVGQPRLGEPEVATAIQASLPGKILRMSCLKRPELIALYQGADWFVFPSLYEGFGLPVLEAMRAGTPVLTTCEASIPEIGGTSVLYTNGRDEVAFTKALREAIAMPQETRRRLIDAAKERSALFSWSRSAERLHRVLLRLSKTAESP